VDGVSQGSSTTDPSTDATELTARYWGNNGASVADSSFLGRLARCAYIAGTELTPQQADHFLYTGRSPVAMTQWLEMGQASPEPDWSGNGLSGTVTGATVADHAPVAPLFSFAGWQGAYTAPAASGIVPIVDRQYRQRFA